MDKIKILNLKFNQIMFVIAGICLVAAVGLVVLNGILRRFSVPISGTSEIVGWLAAIVTAFSLGISQIERVHVDIDLLFNRFNTGIRKGITVFCSLLSIGFFLLLVVQFVVYALSLHASNTLSTTLRIPYYPIILISAVGIFGMVTTLLIQLLESLIRKEDAGER